VGKRDPTPSIAFRPERDAHRPRPNVPDGAKRHNAAEHSARMAARRPPPINTDLPSSSPPVTAGLGGGEDVSTGGAGGERVTMTVVVPAGAEAGSVLFIEGPGGVTYAFGVPLGAKEGSRVEFTVPVHHGPPPTTMVWPPKNLPRPSTAPSSDRNPISGGDERDARAGAAKAGAMDAATDESKDESRDDGSAPQWERQHSPDVVVKLPESLQRQLSKDSMPSLVSPNDSPARDRSSDGPSPSGFMADVPKARPPPRSPRPQASLQKQKSASSLLSENPYLE